MKTMRDKNRSNHDKTQNQANKRQLSQAMYRTSKLQGVVHSCCLLQINDYTP